MKEQQPIQLKLNLPIHPTERPLEPIPVDESQLSPSELNELKLKQYKAREYAKENDLRGVFCLVQRRRFKIPEY